MALLAVAEERTAGSNLPRQFRSPLEGYRYDQLKKLSAPKQKDGIEDLRYEPSYVIRIGQIAVGTYSPDFEYKMGNYRIAEDVKGRVIEKYSHLNMQMLVALNPDIHEGWIVQVGRKKSEISERYTKEDFLIEPEPESLTQVANSSKSEIEKISDIRRILSKWSCRIDCANSSEELWVNALQQAKKDGVILDFWVKPEIYLDLGHVRIFLKPYVPFCIYETTNREFVLFDVMHNSLPRDYWTIFNVAKVVLKDGIKFFKTYLKTIVIEEWSRDLPGKTGVRPREPRRVNPYEDLARVRFIDLVK
jgi:hypothetical protein